MKSDLIELYKETFETWRFQIESYWTRNTYFAAFEVAGLGGVWTISGEHHWTAAFASVMAVFLTVIWLLNCLKQLEYIRFWWAKLIEFDQVFAAEWKSNTTANTMHNGLDPVLLASDFERWRMARPKSGRPKKEYEYSMLVLLVQVIFALLWIYLFAYNGWDLKRLGLLPSW